VAQRKHKVGERALFQPHNQLLVGILGKLTRVFFEDGLRGLGLRGVKQHNGYRIFTGRLHDAGELRGQHLHTDAGVASGKAELDQLSGPPFHVFRGRTVIKDYESVGAFETHTYHFQPKFHFVLLADDDIQPRVSLSEAVQGLFISERRADEHDVIEPAAKRGAELVHEEPRFAWVGRPHDERVEGDLDGVHFI